MSNAIVNLRLGAAAALIGFATSAHALVIVPAFDSSFSSAADPTAAQAAVQLAITTIDGLYTTSGSIPVLFKYNAGLGGGASTSTVTSTYSYNSWLADLQAIHTSRPGDATLGTALTHLPSSGSVAQGITVTVPYATLIMGQPLSLCFNGSGSFVPACGSAYAAVVTVSASSNPSGYYASSSGYSSTAVSVVEHELDEVLGGGGAGTTLTSSSSGTPTDYGPIDLYRFASGNGTDCTGAMGVRSWSASAPVTCYSINGGASAIVDAIGQPIRMGTGGSGSDFGDFFNLSYPNIQDAFVPGGAIPVYGPSSPEYTMLLSIGYTGVVPEPGSLSVLGVAAGALALIRRRRAPVA